MMLNRITVVQNIFFYRYCWNTMLYAVSLSFSYFYLIFWKIDARGSRESKYFICRPYINKLYYLFFERTICNRFYYANTYWKTYNCKLKFNIYYNIKLVYFNFNYIYLLLYNNSNNLYIILLFISIFNIT